MESSPKVRQLPRGRHRLTREEVVTDQRMRMLEAMGEVVAEEGYVATTVTKVIKRAGVSRETFYEQFDDKESCFLAALETGAELMAQQVGSALGDDPADPAERFSSALDAYLGTLAENPAMARTFLIEAFAAGPQALRRRMELQQLFVDTAAAVFVPRDDEERFAVEAIVAAISSLVTSRVATGRSDELPDLHEPLMGFIRRALEQRRGAG